MIDTQQELISRQHEEIQILRHQLMCAEQTRDHLRQTVNEMRQQLDATDQQIETAVKEAVKIVERQIEPNCPCQICRHYERLAEYE